MNRPELHRLAATLGALLPVLAASAQEQPTTTRSSAPTSNALPATISTALADIRDLALDFDQPGFYALLGYTKAHPPSPYADPPPMRLDDWRSAVERPRDFRGQAVTVEGVVGRNRSYQMPSHREFGTVWQIELYRHDQPLTCTLILTRNADDLPIGATVDVTGYFVMARQYLSEAGQTKQALLLIAAGPTSVSTAAPVIAVGRGWEQRDWGWLLGAGVAGLLVAWALLRRAARTSTHDLHTLRARGTPRESLADDLAEWAKEAPLRPEDDRDA